MGAIDRVIVWRLIRPYQGDVLLLSLSRTPQGHLMKNRANNLLLPAVFAAAFSAAVAQANCDAVINALEKAQAQPRLAQYSVDSREQPLTGQPMLVRIGTAEYTSYEVGGQFSHFER
jgi:hypothetical protein